MCEVDPFQAVVIEYSTQNVSTETMHCTNVLNAVDQAFICFANMDRLSKLVAVSAFAIRESRFNTL